MHAAWKLSLASLLLLALPAARASAGVITVAADGSGDFTSINSAVLVAADGDTLVVRPGHYGAFTVGGSRSITVTSDGSGDVFVDGPMGVLSGAAGKTFVFSGLTSHGVIGSAGLYQGYGFWTLNTAGTVRVQDCSLTGADGDPDGWEVDFSFTMKITGHAAGWHGVWLKDSPGSIALNDCKIEGGTATYMASYPDPDCGCTYGEPGGDGVHVESSVVTLADCEVEAGYGATADRQGGQGGMGLNVVSGSAVASGGSWEGGDGGGAFDYIGIVYGGNGGHGILAAPGSVVWERGALLLGGAGGGSLTGDVGAPGLPIYGPATQFAGAARSLAVTAPSYTAGTLSVTLTGQPGDLALLFVSATPGQFSSLKFGGSLLVGGAALTVPLGVLPAGGQLMLGSPVPAIAPLVELPIFLQGLAGVPGDTAFTGAATIILVDPAAL
jgi:hypothetical protein